MANYTNLKAAIAEVIKQNGNNEITGNILQSVLTTMVSTLGMYGQFAGIATPTTNPGNPDQNVFYLTTTPGIYTNFGGITVSGGVQIITNVSGQWAALSSSVASIYITEPFNPKFPEENNGKYLMSNGNLGTSSTQPLWRVSEYFPIENTRSVTLYNTYNNAYSLRYAFYDSNKTFISGSDIDDGDVVTETIYADDYPANAAYMRVAGIDGDGHAKPTIIIGVPLADLNSNFWTLYQQVQDLALAVTGGADSQTVNFLSAYSLVQLGTMIPVGSTITSITGDVNSITGRTNQSDETYQVLSVGTVTNRNISWVKNNESNYGTCTIGYTVSNGLINRVDGLAALLSQVYDEIYGAVKSETLEYPNAWGTRETSATIKKGSLINITGALSGASLVGRTNENDAYGQDLYDGVIADRDINFVRYGETGTLNFIVTSYGILGALSEIDDKIDDINAIVDGEGDSCTVSFVATFQNRELPFTIPQGTEVYISGDITQLNCRTNQNDSTYQIIRNGDVADRNINWVKNQETLGSCTIKIYSNKGLSLRVADLEREMQHGVSAASKKSAYEALRSVKAAGFAKPLKILVAGNSWSLNATNYLGEILASIGIPVKIGVCYVGSGSLMQLWNNIQSETAAYELHIWENGTWSRPSTLRTYQYIVNAEMWDIITHQQVSGDSGIYSTYQPYLHNIIEWEKENIPQLPLFGILATWAYPSTNTSTAFIENYGGDTTTMYNAIISAYNQAMTAENIDFVFPCTPVIQQARTLSISDIDTVDGTHLATNGYYIASMALAETLLKMYYQQRNTEKWTVSKSTYTIGSLTSSQIESIKNLVKTIVSSITTYFTLAKSWPEEIKWGDAMKLYNTTGQNTDGAMTQVAVTKELYPLKGEYNAELAWNSGHTQARAYLYGNFKSGDTIKVWFTGTGNAGKKLVLRYDDETTTIGMYYNNDSPVYVTLSRDSEFLLVLLNNNNVTSAGTFIAHIKYGHGLLLERDEKPTVDSIKLVESGGVYARCKEDEEYLQSLAMQLRMSNSENVVSPSGYEDDKLLDVNTAGKAYLKAAVSSGFYRVYVYDLSNVTSDKINISAKSSQYVPYYAFFTSSDFTAENNVGKIYRRTESGNAGAKTFFEVEIPNDAQYLVVQATGTFVTEVTTRVQPSEIISGVSVAALLAQKLVRADANQSLTDSEKSRVWTNIGLSNTNFYYLEYWGNQSAGIIALSPGTYYYNSYYEDLGLKTAAAGTAGATRIPIKKNDLCYYNGKFYMSLNGSTLTDISSIIIQGYITQTKGTDTEKVMSQNALLPTIAKVDSIIFDDNTEDFTLTPTVRDDEYVKINGDTNSHGSFQLYVYNIEGIANKLKIIGSESWQNPFYAFYSSSNLSASTLLYVTDKGANATTEETFDNVIIPAGAKYLAVNKFDGKHASVAKKVNIIDNPVKNVVHRLKGKKWACIGDSLTEVNQRTTKHYFDYIAEETGIVPLNYGKSGTGYAKSYNTYTPFYDRIASIDETVDVITIFGSFNDLGMLSSEFLIGTKTDTGTTTMAGCINTTIDNIQTRFPLARLGIVSPTPWNTNHPGGASTNSNNYVAIIKEICEYRSIPFLDLWRCSNLRPWDASFREIAYSKDEGNGVHPDENGHKLIAPMIRQFVESLI